MEQVAQSHVEGDSSKQKKQQNQRPCGWKDLVSSRDRRVETSVPVTE